MSISLFNDSFNFNTEFLNNPLVIDLQVISFWTCPFISLTGVVSLINFVRNIYLVLYKELFLISHNYFIYNIIVNCLSYEKDVDKEK